MQVPVVFMVQNTTMPFSEQHGVDHPLQFYAATKRANELNIATATYSNYKPLAYVFFTVYGPWTRPDMALFKFTKNIFAGQSQYSIMAINIVTSPISMILLKVSLYQ